MEETPPFDVARDRLRDFLRREGWPSDLIWRRPDDIVRGPADKRILVRRRGARGAADWARDYFEAGRGRELGVSIDVACALAGAACATVFWTADPDEAARRLIPEQGLKMCIAVPRRPGVPVTALEWWLARRRQRAWDLVSVKAARPSP